MELFTAFLKVLCPQPEVTKQENRQWSGINVRTVEKTISQTKKSQRTLFVFSKKNTHCLMMVYYLYQVSRQYLQWF